MEIDCHLLLECPNAKMVWEWLELDALKLQKGASSWLDVVDYLVRMGNWSLQWWCEACRSLSVI